MSRGWEGLQTGCFRIDEDSGEDRDGKKGGSKKERKEESYKLVIREKGMLYVGRGLQICCLDGIKEERKMDSITMTLSITFPIDFGVGVLYRV